MRTEPFHEELEVELSEDERNLRGRQASRLSVAVRAQKERAKKVKKDLHDEEVKLTEALHGAADAAETGREKRQVPCVDVLRGWVVETIRQDTGARVGSRPATKAEMDAEDEPDEPPAPAKGYTPEQLTSKISRLILEHCAKPRAESLLTKALGKGCPEATPEQIKAAIGSALDRGVIVEDGGKLAVPSTDDDAIVPEGYGRPEAH